MSRVEFAEIMAVLAASVGKPPPQEQVLVYFEALGHWPANVLRAAALRALMEHQINTIPPVGLVAKHARELTSPGMPLATAWAKVRAVAERWSFWLTGEMPTDEKTRERMQADIDALPPAALGAARSYGWAAILDTPPAVAFAHFQRNYESLGQVERREAELPPAARLTPELSAVIGTIGKLPEGQAS